MPSKDDALRVLDEALKAAEDAEFSGIAITALWIHKRLEAQFGVKLNAMPTCCSAMEERFAIGRDWFRRGKDRSAWHERVNGGYTSTFEVLFSLPR